MIRVTNGYILTPGQTKKTTLSDTVEQVTHYIVAPKTVYATPSSGSGRVPMCVSSTGYYATVGDAGLRTTDGFIAGTSFTIEALHIKWHSADSRFYYYADAKCLFKYFATWENDRWQWWKQYTYDNEYWSEPYPFNWSILDSTQDPSTLKSAIAFTPYSPYMRNLCYNGEYYAVGPYAYLYFTGINDGQKYLENVRTDDEYGNDWCLLFEQERLDQPFLNTDYIHTINSNGGQL